MTKNQETDIIKIPQDGTLDVVMPDGYIWTIMTTANGRPVMQRGDPAPKKPDKPKAPPGGPVKVIDAVATDDTVEVK